jgi:BirA family biotin operon repressor/biotin-[acetyl-CoA-carboxylase] ligase
MDVAKEMLKLGQVSRVDSNRMEPGGIMALDQTEGRGQRGRTWYSAPGDSLCVTYFVPLTDAEFREAGKIAILAGAAVASALDGLFRSDVALDTSNVNTAGAGTPASRFGLKWPNDLVVSGKKLGGILVEIVPDAHGDMVALVGVGINVGVRRFPSDLAAACTSLAIEGLFPESLNAMANSIRESLDRWIAIQSSYGFSATMQEWRQYDKTAGRRYRTEAMRGTQIGEAVEVDGNGALIVRIDSGALLTVLSASSTSEV